MNRIKELCGKYWQRPYCYIIVAIIVTLIAEVIFFLFGNKGIFEKGEEFAFSVFLEAFFYICNYYPNREKIGLNKKEKKKKTTVSQYINTHIMMHTGYGNELIIWVTK